MTGGPESTRHDRLRVLVLALSVALVASVVVAAVQLRADRPRQRVSTSQGTTPTPEAAPSSWLAGLGSRVSLATPVLLEDKVLFPGADKPVSGVEGVVTAVTAFDGGLLVTWAPPDANSRLSFLTDKGELEGFGGQTTPGHAVDATGTRVAYGSLDHSDVRVVRLGTNRRVAVTTEAGRRVPGTPAGWRGDTVLLSTQLPPGPGVHLWDTVGGTVTRLGDEGRYSSAVAVVGDIAVVRQDDAVCSRGVDLRDSREVWDTCSLFLAGSPSGRRVLVAPDPTKPLGESRYATFSAVGGGGSTPLALPEVGVVAAGWSDEQTVAAVVRVRGEKADSWEVVACPVTGAACHRVHERRLRASSGAADGRAWVVSARG